MEAVDVLIIGVREAGAALGAALAAEQSGLQVLLVDSDATARAGGEVVQPFVLPYLERWGVLERLCRASSAPIERGEVWHSQAGRLLVTPYSAMGVEGFPTALAVRRPQLRQAYLDAACSNGSVCYSAGTRYAGIRARDERGVLVELHHERETRLVRTSWLVGADGPQSSVRRDAGIGVQAPPYEYDLLLARAERPGMLAGGAAHFFGPWGFAALLDLPGGWSNLLVAVPHQRVGSYLALSDAERDADVRRRAPVLAGSSIDWSGTRLDHLERQHAQQYGRDRVVLVGSAARIGSPLLGMDIALDIEDAAVLAPLLAQRTSVLSPAQLHAAYRSQRRSRNLSIMQKSERLGAWQVGTNAWVHTAMRHWLCLLQQQPRLLKQGLLYTYGLSPAGAGKTGSTGPSAGETAD